MEGQDNSQDENHPRDPPDFSIQYVRFGPNPESDEPATDSSTSAPNGGEESDARGVDAGGEPETSSTRTEQDRFMRGRPTFAHFLFQFTTRFAPVRYKASAQAIKDLKRIPVAELASEEKNCTICYEPMEDFTGECGDGLRINPDDHSCAGMPCGHHFGMICLRSWLEKAASCPLCRQQVDSQQDEDSEDVRSGFQVFNVNLDFLMPEDRRHTSQADARNARAEARAEMRDARERNEDPWRQLFGSLAHVILPHERLAELRRGREGQGSPERSTERSTTERSTAESAPEEAQTNHNTSAPDLNTHADPQSAPEPGRTNEPSASRSPESESNRLMLFIHHDGTATQRPANLQQEAAERILRRMRQHQMEQQQQANQETRRRGPDRHSLPRQHPYQREDR